MFWLFLSAYLPLFISFSLYFIGQHSMTGWDDIRKYLKISNRQMWLHSLPFHSAAWIFLLCFIIIFPSTHFFQEQNLWAIFFVFISSISFPHVIFMNYVYTSKK
ncbi:MAG: Brp/Blh family beta-carotene 15,15'-dioxygenase [Sediminibacterium sp.]